MSWKEHVLKPSSDLEKAFSNYQSSVDRGEYKFDIPSCKKTCSPSLDIPKFTEYKIIPKEPTKRSRKPNLQMVEERLDMLFCLTEGLTIQEIAKKYGQSYKGIALHLWKLRQHYGMKNNEQLVKYVIQNNLF